MAANMTVPVTFGDCDPAGIVFYPNIFRWMDAAFHNWTRPLGGHTAICQRLGAVGLGLMDASAAFKAPIRDGDTLEVAIAAIDWSEKTMTLNYTGRVGDRLAFEGREVRGLFKLVERGIVAAELGELRDILETGDVG